MRSFLKCALEIMLLLLCVPGCSSETHNTTFTTAPPDTTPADTTPADTTPADTTPPDTTPDTPATTAPIINTSKPPYDLNGTRIMFAGNSFTYYGDCVINSSGSPTSNQGYFQKIAAKYGDNVNVTNFTYGSAGFSDGRSKASDDGLPSSYSDYGLYQLKKPEVSEHQRQENSRYYDYNIIYK